MTEEILEPSFANAIAAIEQASGFRRHGVRTGLVRFAGSPNP